jgi:hypothetical protein
MLNQDFKEFIQSLNVGLTQFDVEVPLLFMAIHVIQRNK